ncbi:MAG: hypothetical protein V4772_09860 [Pseudomonadota bacterium]
MNTLLKNIFGRVETTADKAAPNNHAGPQSQQDTAESATRRQLAQTLLQQVMRRNGLPPAWVECHILVLSSRTRGSVAHLKLTLKHGDERLLQYIFAIQKELQKELFVTDPSASRWLNGVSWQLDIDHSCTRKTLPDKSFWQPVIAAQDAKNLPPKSPAQPAAAAAAPLPIPQAAVPQAVPRPVQPPPRAASAAPRPMAAPAAPAHSAAAKPAAPVIPAAPATSGNAPLPASAINALRQLRESRAGAPPLPAPTVSLPPAPAPVLAARPVSAPGTSPALAAAHAAVPSTPPRTANHVSHSSPGPAKEQGDKPLPKSSLDYGAPNFECSRPAEETDLTPELARLFSLNDDEWRDEVKKQVSAVGYEKTQPFRKPGK